jgi:hypothetical protein
MIKKNNYKNKDQNYIKKNKWSKMWRE